MSPRKGGRIAQLVPKSKHRAAAAQAAQPGRGAQPANAARGRRRRAFPLPIHPAIAAPLSDLAPRVRIAVDADCPNCGYPERFYEPARQVFGCSSLNPPAVRLRVDRA